MPDDLTDDIAAAALEPAEASGDAGSFKARTIDEMIAADSYAKAATATATTNENGGQLSGLRLLRPARIVPPGSI